MICKRIRELRVEKQLTQSEIGDMLGISQSRYSKYENGKRTIPLDMICELARFYCVNVDFIVELTDVRDSYPNL